MIKTKYIILSVIGFILISVGLLVYYFIPKSYITFETAPNQVSILIDNKDKRTIKNGDKIIVSPGKHTIVVSRDNFSSYSDNIDVKNKETVSFVVALLPKNNSAREELDNPESQSVMEKFSSLRMTQATKTLDDNYPILKILPIEARLYIVYACKSQLYPNDSSKMALCIDITPSDDTVENLKTYALENIRSKGYNPDDYEIIWSVESY